MKAYTHYEANPKVLAACKELEQQTNSLPNRAIEYIMKAKVRTLAQIQNAFNSGNLIEYIYITNKF